MVLTAKPERQPHTATAIRNYIGLTVVFFLLILIMPANRMAMATYSISARQYHVLLFLVELPLAAIWLASFVAYARLHEYADVLHTSQESPHFNRLAQGCKWLAYGLFASSFITLVLNSIAGTHPGVQTAAIIIANYLELLFPLVAFTKMSVGSRALARHAKIRFDSRAALILQLAFASLGVLYCYLVFRHLDLSNLSSAHNPYYLPGWLLVISLLIPYLYSWFTGLLAAYEIAVLAQRSKGVLYRQALRLFASGLVIVIACFIASQYIRSAIPRTGHFSLNTTLVAVYLIYLVATAGFICMAIGASRLKRIEEV